MFDEAGAAVRLRVSLAAWRWAAGSGLVPAADAGEGRWSRVVVESVDAEGVRAGLRGPVPACWAAERLTEALGVPVPLRRPRVTAAAVGHLVRAGYLVRLGGEREFPDVHPDQVAALARRRDLPAVLDRCVPLGPGEAAVRLGVRRTDFDHVVRLGWVSPVGRVDVDLGRACGGVVEVPLYSAVDVALLPVVRPAVDWWGVRRTGPGRRSLLAVLLPVVPGGDLVELGEVARIAGVGRVAVTSWRRRLPGFPPPVAGQGTGVRPVFERRAVVAWLLAAGRLAVPGAPGTASLRVSGAGTRTGAVRTVRLDDPVLVLAEAVTGTDRVSGWLPETGADVLDVLGEGPAGLAVERLTAPGAGAVGLGVLGGARVSERVRSGGGWCWVEVSWPARVRGR
ncbi:hypothetical protein [Streptomyces sp. NPDC051567]|uniref:hypothetical protein n=1 Tax=Streptomyces sp. NPDC051567 TaxID=3365660 RepID=UPI0037AC0704